MVLVTLFTIILTGCKKEENDILPASTQTTTYNVYVHDMNVPNTISAECLVIEYSSQNEPLETYRFNVAANQIIQKNYTAKSYSTKIKIAFNLKSLTSSNSSVMWVQKVFYLEKGQNTKIEVTGDSPCGSSEP